MRESNTITTSYHLFVLMFKHTYFDSKFEGINQKLFALGWPIKATLINLLSLTCHFDKELSYLLILYYVSSISYWLRNTTFKKLYFYKIWNFGKLIQLYIITFWLITFIFRKQRNLPINFFNNHGRIKPWCLYIRCDVSCLKLSKNWYVPNKRPTVYHMSYDIPHSLS